MTICDITNNIASNTSIDTKLFILITIIDNNDSLTASGYNYNYIYIYFIYK